MSTSVCEDVQESMDTSSAQQEGGPGTPMEESMSAENDQSQAVADTSTASGEGDDDTPVTDAGDDIPYDTT